MNLVPLGRGDFAIGPRPRGGDGLEPDLSSLRSHGFTIVASLLPPAEAWELELRQEPEVCRSLSLQFWHWPIPDMTVPADRGGFERFTTELYQRIALEGGRAYCHCRAGLGRAPLLGCSLLVLGGMSPEDAWGLLSDKRGQMVPETAAQREWVRGITHPFRNALPTTRRQE